MEKENINRRQFIGKSFKTIVAGSLVLSAIDIEKLLASTDNDTSTLPAKIIDLAEYPELSRVGGYVMITEKVIVIRIAKDKFVALNIKCSHKSCDVEYNGESFECPCHGSTYTKTGVVVDGPAKKNLKSYKTTYTASDNSLTINM